MNHVEYEVRNRIGWVTLSRPEKRNALNPSLVQELKHTLRRAESEEEVKVVILRAKGETFCAGADLEYIQQLQNFSHEENLADSNNLKELFLLIYTLKKIVIAQVEGHALAGGCGLATVCDYVFSVPEAKFGYTEVKIGFVPAIVMVFLLRKIGEARSKQMLLSGDPVTAEEAKQIGFVNAIYTHENIGKEVEMFAGKLVNTNSGNSMMLTKQMIAEVQSMPLDKALAYAADMNARARSTDDCKKGIAAFLTKVKPTW